MLSSILTPDLFAAALRMATPLALAAIGGTICERSGVINIALEGIMLVGAFCGVAVTMVAQGSSVAFIAQNATWIGLLAAVISGVLFSGIHAFGAITLRMDHVVSGTALHPGAETEGPTPIRCPCGGEITAFVPGSVNTERLVVRMKKATG